MTHLALRRPITVTMICVALCLLGIISWQRLAVQLLPQFILPQVYVSGGIAGASPEKIERELVIPIEEEIALLENVQEIRSSVHSDYANIEVRFDHGTDMKFTILKLQQKMNAVQNRIQEAVRIEVNKFDTADLSSFLMEISIRGDATLEHLREVAERRVLRQIEQVDGVVNVGIGGGDRRNIGIEIDGERCEALRIRFDMIQNRINAFHSQTQQLGRVISNGKDLDVVLIGRVDDLDELKNLVIDAEKNVRLKDIARVGYSVEERTQLYRVDGKPRVGIFVIKDNESNMLRVAANVEKKIAAINRDLQDTGYEVRVNFSQAALIQEAIDRIEQLALTGALLAIIILFLFLRNINYVTILIIAIPISLLITFNFLYAFDLSINILSLCGLALAIGMLVDNGIVVLENIFLQHQAGKPPKAAALDGTREVSRSIFAATGTTILVFFPVLFVESSAKLFVRELSLSVIFPLAVSLVVSLTLIPLLATRALQGKPMKPFKAGRVYQIYRLLLKSAIRHRVRTITSVCAFLLLSITIGAGFIITQAPPPPAARLDLYVTMPRGATLEATDQIVRRLEDQMLTLPDIEEIRANIRAEEAHVSGKFLPAPQRSEKLNLTKHKEKIEDDNRRLEGVILAFDRPRGRGSGSGGGGISDLLNQEESLSLKGQDLQSLRLLSEQIVETLQDIPELNYRSVDSDMRGGAPELQIRGDRIRLALWGLSMQDVMQAIWSTRPEGTRTTTGYPVSGYDLDIQLQLKDIKERRLEDVGKMRVPNSAGNLIPINQVSTIRVDEGAGNITRLNQERHVKITYELLEEVQKSKSRTELAKLQIDRLIRDLRLPAGFTLEKVEVESERTVYYWMLAIGALLIFMFLAGQFESLSMPVIILGTIPTAMIGALFALAITGTPLSLGAGAPMALLGLIVLLGVVVNNGIILLDRIAILRHQRGYRWQRAVMVAGQSRIRPILMTSATTVLGLFPLALKQGGEFELWPPFAITVIGGLAVSALSTLVFIPVLYVGLEQTKAWLKRIGWLNLIIGSIVATILTIWFHDSYQSKLYTSLLVLPLWFGIMGIIYSIQGLFSVRRERAVLSAEKLHISIGKLTKIYGAQGRFIRQWQQEKRRNERMLAQNIVPWTKEGLSQSAVWMSSIGLILLYLHYFLSSGFWLFILSIAGLVWALAVRELWYRYRFVRGWRPKVRRKRTLLSFLKRRKAEKETAEPANPAKFRRGGTSLMVLAFLAYLWFRLGSVPFIIIAILITLILARFNRICRRIESGEIDPEHPKGRLRKIKRLIYTVAKSTPFIRPPKQEVVALKGVDLNIGQGMFGLLGPNGAGKTTLMRILVGVLDADHGSIKINQYKLTEHRSTFHGLIGYLPQDFGLYENMTPEEYLNYHALTNGIYEKSRRDELIQYTLKSVGMWDRRDDKIKTFSGGMKQRVGIAQTLLHLPQIIVVDEPTAGLDPKQRIKFRNLLAELAKERIVIFSTHIVEDISSTCNDLAVLNHGELVFKGPPKNMQAMARGKVFEATIHEDEFEQWQQKVNIVQHSKSEQGIRIRYLDENGSADLPGKQVDPTLEDAYVLLLHA